MQTGKTRVVPDFPNRLALASDCLQAPLPFPPLPSFPRLISSHHLSHLLVFLSPRLDNLSISLDHRLLRFRLLSTCGTSRSQQLRVSVATCQPVIANRQLCSSLSPTQVHHNVCQPGQVSRRSRRQPSPERSSPRRWSSPCRKAFRRRCQEVFQGHQGCGQGRSPHPRCPDCFQQDHRERTGKDPLSLFRLVFHCALTNSVASLPMSLRPISRYVELQACALALIAIFVSNPSGQNNVDTRSQILSSSSYPLLGVVVDRCFWPKARLLLP